MTKELYTLSVDSSLNKAREILEKKKIRHLPVVKGEKLVGILSLTDILRLSFGNTYGSSEFDVDESLADMLSVEQVMKHKPVVVSALDSIKKVADILTKEEFHALPVVEGEKLVGIVTTTDIIRYLMQKTYN